MRPAITFLNIQLSNSRDQPGTGEKIRMTNLLVFCRKADIIPSLTVGKQKTVVKPVKSMLAAVFCFVAICAIVLYFYTMVNLFLLSA